MMYPPELLGLGLSPVQAGVKASFKHLPTIKPGYKPIVYPKTPTGTTMNTGIFPQVLRISEQMRKQHQAVRPPVQSPPIMPQPTVLLPPVPVPPVATTMPGQMPVVPTGAPIEAGITATSDTPEMPSLPQPFLPAPQESLVKRHWPWLAGGALVTAGVVGFLVLRR